MSTCQKTLLESYNRASDDYKEKTCLMDSIFYSLCGNHFEHSDIGEVRAKLYIIGRGFATRVEAHVPKRNELGALDTLAVFLYERRADFDSVFQEMKQIGKSLDAETLVKIANLHGKLVQLLHGVSDKDLTTFAAKYMHCHCPSIPIYDNEVKKMLLVK